MDAHPEIGMGKVKETEYFNTNYEKGDEWYESHFKNLETKKVVGEISNNYYLDAEVAKRINNYNPNIKIIINVREPVNLLRSFYEFGKRRGLDLLPSIQDNLNEPIGKFMGSGYDYRLKRNMLVQTDKVSLFESVLLSNLLTPFLKTFPREQVYIFIFERLRHDPDNVLKEIYSFLGVNPEFQPNLLEKVVNQSISPKSKFVAQLGSKLAFVLRRGGYYSLLSWMHKSVFIKRLLFRPLNNGASSPCASSGKLDRETLCILSKEKQRLVSLIPELANYWEST
ncbi:MAG: hypothetical protein NPIRA02_42260 [Nitrospirales bacterium]|nr:MAG: hypothetical protein NPIRA02_42260 [Nitrospirales bacterium]